MLPSSGKTQFIGRYGMKKEDLWLIGVVAFSIIWTLAFGWGVFG
jgi:hypothetical protein